MLQGRPLYDTEADRRYFVTPEAWHHLTRAVDRWSNVLLVGPRGAGKTTLLRQLQLAMRNQDESVEFVDATAVVNTGDLVASIRQALRGGRSAAESMRAGVDATARALGGDPAPPPGASRAMVLDLEEIAAVSKTTVLLDASGSGDAVYGLFGRLRDTLWRMPHSWVVAVDEQDRATALRPPADAFFDVRLQLDPLSIENLIELLRRRGATGEFNERALLELATAADGNPRAVIRAAMEALVTGRDPAEALSDRARLLERAAALGRPHGMLMAELLDLGQASPSDDTLQGRLGLTRGRITALLREMLDKGLLETDAQKSAGPGRPKTVYRPRIGVPQ
jgi:hypothetical protein